MRKIAYALFLLVRLVSPARAGSDYPYMTPPEHGPLSRDVRVYNTAWTQVGPNGVPWREIYADGILAASVGETISVGAGDRGCRKVDTIFAKYVGVGAVLIFTGVVPPGKTLCVRQSNKHAFLAGFVNTLSVPAGKNTTL